MGKAKGETKGVWIPQSVADALPRLSLQSPSQWRVFMVVLMTWCRYGCQEARLAIRDISKETGLAKRTVQYALKDLIKLGLLRRTGWYKRLAVVAEALPTGQAEPTEPAGQAQESGGANKVAPRRCNQGCTSPTLFNSLIDNKLHFLRTD
jgi:predicted DNA-binding transcriptional regulator